MSSPFAALPRACAIKRASRSVALLINTVNPYRVADVRPIVSFRRASRLQTEQRRCASAQSLHPPGREGEDSPSHGSSDAPHFSPALERGPDAALEPEEIDRRRG